MPRFQFLLKNEKLKQYNQIALYIILINLLAFAYIAIAITEKDIRISAIITVVILASALAIDYFLGKIKNNEDTPYKLLAEYIIALAWLKAGFWWLAVLFFILGMLYLGAKRKLLVSIFTDKILYPSLPQKNISWPELNAIILKDGLLTIDFKNNKLIQQAIDENSTVNEQDFNEFCRQQLKK